MSKYNSIFSEYDRISKVLEGFSAYTNAMPKIPDYLTEVTRAMQPIADYSKQLEMMQGSLESTIPRFNQLGMAGAADFSAQAKLLLGFNTQFTDCFSLLRSEFSFMDSLSIVRNQIPAVFNYERNFSKSYYEFYDEILDDSFSPKLDEYGDLEWKNEKSRIYSPTIKDIYGLPKLFEDISRQEVQELLEILSVHPYTALENPIAKNILNRMRNSLKKHLKELCTGSTFLHGRKHTRGEIPFTDDEMMKAPVHCTHTERFNPAENPAYYLGESIETIQKELKPTKEEKDEQELQYIQITTKRPLYVLDIRDKECPVFEFCKYPLKNPSPRPKEYLVPNFIAQCCTQLRETDNIQIDGILYKSTINPSGHCLVLFEANSDYFKITKRDMIPFL